MEELKEKIEEVVAKVKADPDFAKKFQEDPVKALEGVIGIDLPDDKINDLYEWFFFSYGPSHVPVFRR